MGPDLIYDVGVNHGEDTAFYLAKGFRVVGIEANSLLCDEAREKFADAVAAGRLQLVNAAVAETEGPVTFYRNTTVSDWGTTSPDWAARNRRLGTQSDEITVPGMRFESMLEKFGMPYYLKIDIEGADLQCVRALARFNERPRYVSIESTMTSWDGLLQEFELLRDLGYVRFKLVNQLDVPMQVCPFPAREGRYVEHRFVHGSSGMFGDEAPGDWLTHREAVREYRRVFLHYRWFGNDGVLSNFNWERPLIWRAKRYLPARRWYDTHASR